MDSAGRGKPLLTVISGGEVLAPEPLGKRDVVIAGEHILRVGGDPLKTSPGDVEEVSFEGLLLAPGLVDGHVHFLGGGGGDGYDSRAPELQPTDFIANGITTALAPLGIDPVSRSLEGLLAKARALTEAGISAYIYTGGFRRPLLSLTGSPWRDAYLIPDVQGVKLALGVERAPAHLKRDLVDLSRELYWVERATGRRLVIHVHLGPLSGGHALLKDVATELAVPERLVVTHCNRSPEQVETAIVLAGLGVWTDMTCMISEERGMPGSVRASDAVLQMRDAGASLDRVTLSTDGNGAVPERLQNGEWEPYKTNMDSLLDEVRALVQAELPVKEALAMASSKPAEALGLATKGRVAEGADADIIGLGPRLEVREVFARGKRMMAAGRLMELGRYERPER